MALILNKIEALPSGAVQVRHLNTETGQFHREVLTPVDGVRAQAIGGQVQAICESLWTPEILEAWQAKHANSS